MWVLLLFYNLNSASNAVKNIFQKFEPQVDTLPQYEIANETKLEKVKFHFFMIE